MALPRTLGKTAYVIVLPLMRFWLAKTSRSYVLINHGGRVLVIKNWLSRQNWQLPGGGIKKAEGPKVAAARELKEELGIQINPHDLMPLTNGIWESDNLGHSYQTYALNLKSQPKLSRRTWETSDFAWLKPAELNQANAATELLQAVERLNK